MAACGAPEKTEMPRLFVPIGATRTPYCCGKGSDGLCLGFRMSRSLFKITPISVPIMCMGDVSSGFGVSSSGGFILRDMGKTGEGRSDLSSRFGGRGSRLEQRFRCVHSDGGL